LDTTTACYHQESIGSPHNGHKDSNKQGAFQKRRESMVAESITTLKIINLRDEYQAITLKPRWDSVDMARMYEMAKKLRQQTQLQDPLEQRDKVGV
jgi:hypothetical protein